MTSLLVVSGADVVCEEYFHGDAETLRNTRSVTKTVLGMLVGLAIDDGVVPGADARLSELTTQRARPYPDPRKEQITVEDVLTMAWCLECDDRNPFSAGNEERMYLVEDWLQFALDLPIRGFPSCVPGPDDSPYRRSFAYCTAGVAALAIALEHALQESLAAYAARRLLAPLQIAHAEWPRTPLGQTSAAGGLLLTTRALAALGRLYRDAAAAASSRATGSRARSGPTWRSTQTRRADTSGGAAPSAGTRRTT